MIEVYLNFPGNAREALTYYAEVFGAPAPYVMSFADMPEEDRAGAPAGMENMVIYGNLKTFAGDIMMSDDMPDRSAAPTNASWIAVTHTDDAAIRRVFEALAKDGEVLMPLEATFFSPLYGQVKDKFGHHWMLMLPSPMEVPGTAG